MKKNLMILAVGALIAVLIVAAAYFVSHETSGPEAGVRAETAITAEPQQIRCAETKRYTVRGESLQGVVASGEEVIAYPNYYECHKIARGDIVLYHYAGDANPLLKIVRAIPGDSWSLRDTAGGTNIIVSGEILKTSAGEPYKLNARAKKMLTLYIHDYGGVIPSGAYLILGNVAGGSLDSTRFGLIAQSDIIGKAVPLLRK